MKELTFKRTYAISLEQKDIDWIKAYGEIALVDVCDAAASCADVGDLEGWLSIYKVYDTYFINPDEEPGGVNLIYGPIHYKASVHSTHVVEHSPGGF